MKQTKDLSGTRTLPPTVFDTVAFFANLADMATQSSLLSAKLNCFGFCYGGSLLIGGTNSQNPPGHV
jgi:hypothetical protein